MHLLALCISSVYLLLFSVPREGPGCQPTLSRNRTLSRNLRESVWGAHTLPRNLRESVQLRESVGKHLG
jgi:hypothetical protein